MLYKVFALLSTVLILFIGSQFVSYLYSLHRARRFGKTSSIPTVVIYNHRDSFLFWLVSPWLAPFIEKLPFGLGDWIRYAKKDFFWASKGKIYREDLGSDAFWTAGLGGLGFWTSDPHVISQVTHRWKDFPKPIGPYASLEIFGPNVVTTEGATWQRHRKITGPPFNDKNSNLVFSETLVQGKAMLASFTSGAEGSPSSPGSEPAVENLLHWTMTVALNVLSNAAFNLQMPWPTRSVAAKEESSTSDSVQQTVGSIFSNTHTMTFQKSVDLVMNNTPYLVLFPTWFFQKSPFKFLHDLHRASGEFLQYMHEVIASQQPNSIIPTEPGKQQKNSLSGTGADLLSSMIKAGTIDKSNALSEEETVGNVFVFILAGHETTATTLQTALILLACDPQLQQLVQDEIKGIWATKKEGEDLVFEDYPRMRVIMALMMETLRVFPPVGSLPKTTLTDQTLTYRGQTVFIPAGSSVTLDIVSVHRNPDYWGADSQEFRPSRWLMPTTYVAPPNSTNESPSQPQLLCPTKGSFLAFSGGFRGCLGKKFAQVEFCTLIAVLLKEHSVELVSEKGVGWKETRSMALEAVDNRVSELVMRMRKEVKVRFVRRGAESFPPHGQ